MSIRWHFISSKPSSNTANRPTGPAPIITTSVLIGSLISYPSPVRLSKIVGDGDCLARPPPHGKGRQNEGRAAGGWRFRLGLAARRRDHEPVEFLGDLDLARQARMRLHLEGE